MARKLTAALCTATLVVGLTLAVQSSAHAATGEPDILSAGWVTDTSVPSAFGPSATIADNGDIVVLYNTEGDNVVGAKLYVTRSSDEGDTWTTPQLVAEPVHYLDSSSDPIGSINSQASLTTLSNGDLIAPTSESIAHSMYTNVESVTYVLRSTDHGVTWSGNGVPITLPTPMYYNSTYGRVVELSGGDLLMPVWGAPTGPSTPTGIEDPVSWQAGVLRSQDGGATWTDYFVIGLDTVMPPTWSNVSGSVPAQVSETSIAQLEDGRLLAVMRSDHTIAHGQRYFYSSYSSDGGETWTDPVATDVNGTGGHLAVAPCTTSLAGDTTKLFMANNDDPGATMGLRTSFDNGVTWTDRIALQDPPGASGGYAIYPNFLELSGNRMMVVYNRLVSSATRIAFNILQDATGTDCQDQADDAATAAASSLKVFVERSDKDDWPWPYARRQLTFAATTGVASIVSQVANSVICKPAGITLAVDGVALDPGLSLAANGVSNGDTLVVSGVPDTGLAQVGFADRDEYPDVRPLYGWATNCDTLAAFDYHNVSVGVDVDLEPGQVVTSFNVRDSDATNRLTASDYRLWSSSDNKNWTEVTGWAFSSTVVDGRVTHSLSGVAIADRYVKLSQAKSDGAWTFLISSFRDDVWVTTNPSPASCG